MTDKHTGQTPDKISSPVACPGCGQQVESVKWRKRDSLFQSVDCPHCRVSFGRVNGGQWHSLGAIEVKA
jgi:Zn finger protein HypA/HybF involved in hydrogenase expression